MRDPRATGVVPPQQRRADDDGPGLSEVVRRLGDVVDELREMRQEMRTTYVRLDVYNPRHERLDEKISDLREDTNALDLRLDAEMKALRDQAAANRRLAISGLVLPILSGLVLAMILAFVLPQVGS